MADAPSSNGKPLSDLLQDFKNDLLKGRIEDEIEILGRKFRMHTLNDGEIVWRDQFITTASPLTLLSSQKAPTLAAAISHIDGLPIMDQFNLPDDPKLREFLANNPEDLKAHKRERLFALISEMPDILISKMFIFFSGLEERRIKVIENLKNSSTGTSSSESSSTSSPAAGPPAEEAVAETQLEEIPGSSFGG